MVNSVKKRFLDICYRNKLLHIGSGLSCIPILHEIYEKKKKDDIVVLSMGHAAIALYSIIEEFYPNISAEMLYKKHGVHPNRDVKNKIFCSTGSLGIGITISVGYALSNKDRNVYCIISDGECGEGSVWESLRFIQENNLKNINIYVILNGYSALGSINKEYLKKRLYSFYENINIIDICPEYYSFLKGIDAHYHVMTEEEYEMAVKFL